MQLNIPKFLIFALSINFLNHSVVNTCTQFLGPQTHRHALPLLLLINLQHCCLKHSLMFRRSFFCHCYLRHFYIILLSLPPSSLFPSHSLSALSSQRLGHFGSSHHALQIPADRWFERHGHSANSLSEAATLATAEKGSSVHARCSFLPCWRYRSHIDNNWNVKHLHKHSWLKNKTKKQTGLWVEKQGGGGAFEVAIAAFWPCFALVLC